VRTCGAFYDDKGEGEGNGGREGAVYILYFSLNVFFFVFGVEIPKFQWGEDIVLLREHFLSFGVRFSAYMGREFAA
jgi:hypothetical protein